MPVPTYIPRPPISSSSLYGGRTAPCRLDILIIGCGLGGLAAAYTLSQAGHNVTLIEAAKRLSDVGAGIQMSPNASRLLIRWGLGDLLEKKGVEPEAIVFRRYHDGQVVGYSRWGEGMRREHGAPYMHVHRADLFNMVYDLARESDNVNIHLACSVTSVNPTPDAKGKVSVTVASGQTFSGDLIIGADGVKSIVRGVVLGTPGQDQAEPTGDAAYRAIVPTELMMKDPELKPFVETPEMTAWMGPGRHLMGYCIRERKEYNLVLLHPDDGSVESWTAEGSAEKLRADFADYDPRIRRLLSFVDSTLKWRLMDRKPLKSWIHPDNRVVLLGDACHPMLPYRAQGAAMALEDAAVIGNLLSHLSNPSQLPTLLHAYERLRHSRTAKTQASSRLNQRVFHLPDGPLQVERDDRMREAMEEEMRASCVVPSRHSIDANGRWSPTGFGANGNGSDSKAGSEGNPNQWADRTKNMEQFSYDADEAADRWWREEGEAICRKLNPAFA